MVSVIIAALNEERTIEAVIRTAVAHPLVSEVIVVSDGSTDRTVEKSRRTSAVVIALPENVGKGAALGIGVDRATSDILLFLDADLLGLTSHIIDKLIEPVVKGMCDMTVSNRDDLLDHIQYWPRMAVGGERALRRTLWNMVPVEDRRDFQIELALNHHALQHKMRIKIVRAHGLKHLHKIQKYGWRRGLAGEKHTIRCCIGVMWKYHVAEPTIKWKVRLSSIMQQLREDRLVRLRLPRRDR